MVLPPTPAFALRPPEAAQSKETITGLEEAMGAAKHKGILPTQDLIDAIVANSTKVDLSAARWFNQQLGALEVVLEQVARLDWQEYLKRRQASAGGMGVYIQDPQQLLQGVIQVLMDASEQQKISTFNPTTPQILEQIFKIRDGDNRADFLVAFEDSKGIHILEGLAEYLQSQPNGKVLLRALLVNAGVERFLLSQQPAQGRLREVYQGIAHMIAEDMERIVLGIPFDDPAFEEEEYSPLDIAIMAFAREKLGAAVPTAAAVEPAAWPAAAPAPAPAPQPAVPADVAQKVAQINRHLGERGLTSGKLTDEEGKAFLEALPKMNAQYGTNIDELATARAYARHKNKFSESKDPAKRVEAAVGICCLTAKWYPSKWDNRVGFVLEWLGGIRTATGLKNVGAIKTLERFLAIFPEEGQRGKPQIDRLLQSLEKRPETEKVEEKVDKVIQDYQAKQAVSPRPKKEKAAAIRFVAISYDETPDVWIDQSVVGTLPIGVTKGLYREYIELLNQRKLSPPILGELTGYAKWKDNDIEQHLRTIRGVIPEGHIPIWIMPEGETNEEKALLRDIRKFLGSYLAFRVHAQRGTWPHGDGVPIPDAEDWDWRRLYSIMQRGEKILKDLGDPALTALVDRILSVPPPARDAAAGATPPPSARPPTDVATSQEQVLDTFRLIAQLVGSMDPSEEQDWVMLRQSVDKLSLVDPLSADLKDLLVSIHQVSHTMAPSDEADWAALSDALQKLPNVGLIAGGVEPLVQVLREAGLEEPTTDDLKAQEAKLVERLGKLEKQAENPALKDAALSLVADTQKRLVDLRLQITEAEKPAQAPAPPAAPAKPPTVTERVRERLPELREKLRLFIDSFEAGTIREWAEKLRPAIDQVIEGVFTEEDVRVELKKQLQPLLLQAFQGIQIRELFDLFGPVDELERNQFQGVVAKLLDLSSPNLLPEWVSTALRGFSEDEATPEESEIERLKTRLVRLEGRLQEYRALRESKRFPFPEGMQQAMESLIGESRQRLDALERPPAEAPAKTLSQQIQGEVDDFAKKGSKPLMLGEWDDFRGVIVVELVPAAQSPEEQEKERQEADQLLDRLYDELLEQFDEQLEAIVRDLASKTKTWSDALPLIRKHTDVRDVGEDLLQERIREKGLVGLFQRLREEQATKETKVPEPVSVVATAKVLNPQEWLERILAALPESALRRLGNNREPDKQIETVRKIVGGKDGNGNSNGSGVSLLAYVGTPLRSPQGFVSAIKDGYDRVMSQTKGKGHEGSHERHKKVDESKLNAQVAFAILTNETLFSNYVRFYPGRLEVTILEGLYKAYKEKGDEVKSPRAKSFGDLFKLSETASPPTAPSASGGSFVDYFVLLGLTRQYREMLNPERVWQWRETGHRWVLNQSVFPKANVVERAVQNISEIDLKKGTGGLTRKDLLALFLKGNGLQRYIQKWAETTVPKPPRPEGGKVGLEESEGDVADRIKSIEERIERLKKIAKDPTVGQAVQDLIQTLEADALRLQPAAPPKEEPPQEVKFPPGVEVVTIVRPPEYQDAVALAVQVNPDIAKLRESLKEKKPDMGDEEALVRYPDVDPEEALAVLHRVHLYDTDPRIVDVLVEGKKKEMTVRVPHRVEGQLVHVDPADVLILYREKLVSMEAAVDILYQAQVSGISPEDLEEIYSDLRAEHPGVDAAGLLRMEDRLIRLYEHAEGEIEIEGLKAALDAIGDIGVLEDILSEVVFAQGSEAYGVLLQKILEAEAFTVEKAEDLVEPPREEEERTPSSTRRGRFYGPTPKVEPPDQVAKRHFPGIEGEELSDLLRWLDAMRKASSPSQLAIGAPTLLKTLAAMGRGKRAILEAILKEVIYQEPLQFSEGSMRWPYHWRLHEVRRAKAFSVEAARGHLQRQWDRMAQRESGPSAGGTGLEELARDPAFAALSQGPVRLDGLTFTYGAGKVDAVPIAFIPYIPLRGESPYPTSLVSLEEVSLPDGLRLFTQVDLPNLSEGVTPIPVEPTPQAVREVLAGMSPDDVLFVDARKIGLEEIPAEIPGRVIRISGSEAPQLSAQALANLIRIAGLEEDRLLDVRHMTAVDYKGYTVGVLTAA